MRTVTGRVPISPRWDWEGRQESRGEVAAWEEVEETRQEESREEDRRWVRGGGGRWRCVRKWGGANLSLQLPELKKDGQDLINSGWWEPENLLGALDFLLHSFQKLTPLPHLRLRTCIEVKVKPDPPIKIITNLTLQAHQLCFSCFKPCYQWK